ncbi:MAG TPA: hypothetical protein VGO00_09460 [Kofleriaceae bacterium]|jgi:hypothetical protein|nr:hypothetical protein [Kofleriaceae bacterium]
MFADRLRVPWWCAVAVTPLVFALATRAPVTPVPVCCRDLPVIAARPPAHPIDAKARANALYRAGDLAGAVAEVRTIDRDLAELYDQFRRAWLITFDPDSSPGEVFPAVREAWKLDTVLGGAYTDVLYEKTRAIAPLAAEQYVREGRDDEALQASNSALMLGHEVYK